MSELDDRPLTRTPDVEPSEEILEPTPPGRPASGTLIALVVAGLLLGGGAAWWWRSEPASPARSTLPAGSDVAVEPVPQEPARLLPPLGQMDTFLRALLGALSSSPELARWLATDDLIRQLAHSIDRLSRGFSPARDLAVLTPGGQFDVSGPRGRMTIDPRSYRRYNGLASAVSSLDPDAVARAYQTIHPRLDEAYRNLGRTEGSVDEALDAAVAMLLSTPRVEDPIVVVAGKGPTYAFADPRLEGLPPVQRQLIRMGPDNVARIQTRLREIAAAIHAER